MGKLKINTDPRMKEKYSSYPKDVRARIRALRQLVIDTARAMDSVDEIEETLKWGEPSFVTRRGSTLRMDWKEKQPEQYAMYFKCTSRLVETFRDVYPETFKFDGNRAIVFDLDDRVPEKALKRCIEATLQYHDVKKLPSLGID